VSTMASISRSAVSMLESSAANNQISCRSRSASGESR
jgi:hypothetical protein